MLLSKIEHYIEKLCIENNQKKIKEYIILIIEFIFEYGNNLDISKKKVQESRLKKLHERGGFEKGIFLYLFLIHKNDPYILEYQQKTNEYIKSEMTINAYSNDYDVYSCCKLVRDKVPERAIIKNRICFYRYVNNGELKKALYKKLLEEYTELVKANKKTEIIGELVDILEVLYSIASMYKD